MSQDKVNIVIVGGGRGGKSLLKLFNEGKTINVLGVVDILEDAPAVKFARKHGLQTGKDYKSFIKKKEIWDNVQEIVNVTGSDKITEDLLDIRPDNVEVIGGNSAKLMWDVVEEHEALEKEFESRSRFLRTVIESLTHPFYVIDAKNYSVILANQAALQGRELADMKCYCMTHRRETPCDGAEHLCPLKEIIKKKEAITVDHVHYDERGNERYVQVHGFPVFDENDNVVQMIEYSIDVTDQRRAEQSIKEKMHQIEKLNSFMTGREERIIELKEEVNGLLSELGRPTKYAG